MKLVKNGKKVSFLFILSLLIATGTAFATDATLGTLANNVTKSFESIGRLMIAAAYIGGFGLTVAAIFKFKQHKDNPTQIPVGTPIALLVIGIILVFLPGLFGTAGTTVFGSDKQVGGFTGEGVGTISGNNDRAGTSSGLGFLD
jgi:intracellular multiplication protein IcmD